MKSKKRTVVVVDDDEGILDAVTMVLELAGYKVVGLRNGNDVLEKVKKVIPGVVLLDMLISGVDGREVCGWLKEDKQTQDIPVVLISAHPGIKNVASNSKAQGYLSKPFDTKELLKLVKGYCN